MAKRGQNPKLEETTLKELRKDLGLTQAETAANGSILQGDISKLERRTSFDVVSVGMLRRYAEALGGRLEVCAVFGARRVLLKGAEDEKDHYAD